MPTITRQRLTWFAWGCLLLVVVVFGVDALRLTGQVEGQRAELSRNVQVMMALESLPRTTPEATKVLDQAIGRMAQGSRLHRSAEVTRGALGTPQQPDVVRAFVAELRMDNARLSHSLGAAWTHVSLLLFAAIVFAIGALVLGAIAVRSREAQAVLAAALVRQEARAEAANVLRILNKELSIARDDAVAAQRVRSRLLSMLGHELRTPLTSIRGYAELLVEDGRPEGAPLLESTRHLERRAAQILDLSDQEPPTLPPESIDLAEFLTPLVERWGATLNGSARVKTHPSRLERVVEEVLANAAHFGSTVRVLVYVENETGVIEITDDGPGMQPEQIQRATEAFWKANPAEKGGLGLGLAVAEHHLRKLGGALELASQPGEGTTVTLRLSGQA